MASSVHSISYCKIGVLWMRKELREESNESSLFGGSETPFGRSDRLQTGSVHWLRPKAASRNMYYHICSQDWTRVIQLGYHTLSISSSVECAYYLTRSMQSNNARGWTVRCAREARAYATPKKCVRPCLGVCSQSLRGLTRFGSRLLR